MRTRSTPLLALSVLRSTAGLISWASPAHSWRAFGLGPMHQVGSAGVATRLFGVRDLALGMALHHPSADVRKAAVEAGIAIDVLDVAASVIGRRAGAPAASLAGVAAGATLFVVLGVTIIADSAAS
ncbi:hypothetical protein MTX35_18360 [Rhodococcus sp. ARC_M12]|jgi:hypothetical protein|uniref:DUF4267 domain-containing protein n=1 Tax=Rhodococcus navarretei TaxID=3128981 RepID=A0ABU9CYZ3_9NOCA|nr:MULTISPECIES: hypothetical protein [unclassified Rhodococcus (in: high G+C Gram-positive bacteria)]MCJ0890943.1 hypothetical protein [Rhodococcus sp. ARC_M5]MCJ0979679.1 hypothetical protein [Rhodococcus sp. ARC_M12]OZF39516.1 hypothetical protein CH295_02015 [Rhodococcus sp. 14-2483-1-2]